MLFSGNSCSDGFLSSSIGSRGACSHHGGVSFFSKIKVPLIFSITGLVWYFLNTLTKNKKNTTERLELKKFNPVLKKYTVHKEIK